MTTNTNTPDISTLSIDELLKLDEIKCNAERKKRTDEFCRAVRVALLRFPPPMLDAAEGTLARFFRTAPKNAPSKLDGLFDPFFVPLSSPCGQALRERLCEDVARAIVDFGIDFDEAEWNAFNVLSEVAEMYAKSRQIAHARERTRLKDQRDV